MPLATASFSRFLWEKKYHRIIIIIRPPTHCKFFSHLYNDDKKFMLHELRLWDEATKMRDFLQSKSILEFFVNFNSFSWHAIKKFLFFNPFHPRVSMNFSCPLVNKKVIYFNRSRLWNKLLGLFIESKHHVTIVVCFNSYMWT